MILVQTSLRVARRSRASASRRRDTISISPRLLAAILVAGALHAPSRGTDRRAGSARFTGAVAPRQQPGGSPPVGAVRAAARAVGRTATAGNTSTSGRDSFANDRRGKPHGDWPRPRLGPAHRRSLAAKSGGRAAGPLGHPRSVRAQRHVEVEQSPGYQHSGAIAAYRLGSDDRAAGGDRAPIASNAAATGFPGRWKWRRRYHPVGAATTNDRPGISLGPFRRSIG